MKNSRFKYPVLFLFLISTSGIAQSLSDLSAQIHYRFDGSLEGESATKSVPDFVTGIEGMALEISEKSEESYQVETNGLSFSNNDNFSVQFWVKTIADSDERMVILTQKNFLNVLNENDVDVIMMQETYSNGDFIAAELGYYFATTVDWDYLNQGSNISILSRYPIEELFVPEKSAFMNIAAKVAISENQNIYIMSNWYGMDQFQDVFEFHQERFNASEKIPILFGRDFNAVAHTDGGESPASVKLFNSGFTDAYTIL